MTLLCPRQISANKHIITCRTNRGGHLGWHDGLLPTGPSWADNLTIDFLSAVLEQHAQTNFLIDVMRRTQELQRDSPSMRMDSTIAPGVLARIVSKADMALPVAEKVNTRTTSASDQASTGPHTPHLATPPTGGKLLVVRSES